MGPQANMGPERGRSVARLAADAEEAAIADIPLAARHDPTASLPWPARNPTGAGALAGGDPLGPSRGLLLGLAIGVVLWTLIGMAVWRLLP